MTNRIAIWNSLSKILHTLLFAPRCGRAGMRLVLSALVAGTALYWFFGSVLLHETNRNRLASDQQYNIDLSREADGTVWPAHSKGVVNPLWPWVVSFFNDADDETTFQRGRRLNLWVSWAALLGATLLLSRILPPLPLLAAMALSAFGCFLPQAVYFQPETLYYLFFIAAWGCCWRLLTQNPLWLYGVLGMCAGMAFLAKASVTPLIAGFVCISALRWLTVVLPLFSKRLAPPSHWNPWRHVAGLLLVATLFLLPLVPMMLQNRERFGSAFHSYPSYWMWQEDFGGESIPFMTRFNQDREKIPPEEIPGAGNYFRKYGWGHAGERLWKGTGAKLSAFLLPEGGIKKHKRGRPWKELLRHRGMYPLLLLLCAGLMTIPAWRRADNAARWGGLLKAMLLCGPLVVYCLLYGWYDVIGRGDRFMMSLFVPAVVFPLLGGHAMLQNAGRAGRLIYGGGVCLVCLLLLHRLLQVLQNPHFQ